MDIQKQLNEIDRITEMFKSQFGNLSESQLNWKPDPKTWSIAQNIDHLIVINQTYYPVIESIRQNKYSIPWIGKFDFYVNFMGKLILQSVEPARKRKIKTFKIWEPHQSTISADILNRFQKQQSELKQLIRSCEDLVQQGIVISSPANRNVVYKLSTAFDIIITHEVRHFNQAKEIFEMLPAEIKTRV